MEKIAVIGQGYVGLPLACSLIESGYEVHGVDNNERIVNQIRSGLSHIEDVTDLKLKEICNTSRYSVDSIYEGVNACDVIIICVPTPLDKNHRPDLGMLKNSVSQIAPYLKRGSLVILESTSYPGTTRNLVYEEILRLTKFDKEDFDCAFSPERVDPLNPTWNVRNTPKLVSGVNLKSTNRARKFYETFIETVIEVSSPEIAEFAKLIENTYRLINISFVNEMMELCDAANLPINEILDAASTKPYGFSSFRPGLGAGGHCIPVDSVYLKSYSESLDYHPKLLTESISINRRIPEFHAKKILEMAGSKGPGKTKVLIVGVAYKKGVSDTRESPGIHLIELLNDHGFSVNWIDSKVSDLDLAEKHVVGDKYDVVVLNHLDLTNPEDFLNSTGQIYKIS